MTLDTKVAALSPQHETTVDAAKPIGDLTNARHTMDLDCALSVARDCRDEVDDPTVEVSAESAKAAAIALLKEVTASEGHLRRMHAALQRLDDGRPRHAGARLRLGQDGGGHRHFLEDKPVHAGTCLTLLTVDGWLEFRYEWSFDPKSAPTAVLMLPGVYGSTEVHMRLPADARLAWPHRR